MISRDYFLVGVGVSDLLKEINGGSSKDLSKVLIGDGMIIFAQIIVAAQMVIEEKFVNGKNIHPLRLDSNFSKKKSEKSEIISKKYRKKVGVKQHFWSHY